MFPFFSPNLGLYSCMVVLLAGLRPDEVPMIRVKFATSKKSILKDEGVAFTVKHFENQGVTRSI